MTGTLREDLRTLVIISRSVFRRMRNCSGKICIDNQNTHFMFSNCPPPPFPMSCPLRDNVEEYGRAKQTADNSIIGRIRIAVTHIWQHKRKLAVRSEVLEPDYR